jgi:organic radical activating enzyme
MNYQYLVFLTNHCPNLCPHCLCASGPLNQNFLPTELCVDIVPEKMPVHLCGGEPLTHPRWKEIVIELLAKKCPVLVYTSMPDLQAYDSLIEFGSMYKKGKVGFRFSVSEYLTKKDPYHIDRVYKSCAVLKYNKIEFSVSGIDDEVKRYKSINHFHTPMCNSGRDFDHDSMENMGQDMRIIYSNGQIGIEKLIRAHYIEAEISLHKTKLG